MSIVRGTTSVKIVEMLRNCGAKNSHADCKSSCKIPCFYGIDTPNKMTSCFQVFLEIRDYIGVDSLKFISLDGVYKALGCLEETLKIQLILITILVVTILLNWLIRSGKPSSQLSLLIESK